jgi:hypothetical protein
MALVARKTDLEHLTGIQHAMKTLQDRALDAQAAGLNVRYVTFTATGRSVIVLDGIEKDKVSLKK